MTDKPVARSALSQSLTELFCTAALLTVAQTISAIDPSSLAPAVCGVLIGLIYLAFDLSGAHFNPAVTLTFYLRDKIPLSLSVYFIISQLIGACLGVYIAKQIAPANLFGPFVPGKGYSWSNALIAEAMFTTLLCVAILCIALRNNVDPPAVVGIALVGIIYAGILCTANVSGAAFNPAVAISVAVLNGGDFKYACAVSVVNLLSACIATVIFYAVAPEELKYVGWGRWVIAKWNRRNTGEQETNELSRLLPHQS